MGTRRKLLAAHGGFTVLELLIVIIILAILIALLVPQLFSYRERAYLTRANAEFNSMQTAVELYRQDNYGQYPPDVERNLPPELEEYLAGTAGADNWPDGPWPGSVYDYDAFEADGVETYQISIRFCAIGQADTCRFPRADWASDFQVNSSVYFCFEGSCKAHPEESADYPGYCANCRE